MCYDYQANRFHYIVLICWQFSIFLATQQIFPIFSSYVPEWRCSNISEKWGKDCEVFEQCGGISRVEFKKIEFHSAALEFDWICGASAHYRNLFSTFQFFGVLCGTVTFGSLADTYGRRPVSLSVLALGLTFSFLSGLVSNAKILLGMRFLLGLGLGGVLVAHGTHTMELLLPPQRVMIRGFFNWGIARIMLTAICYYFNEWRQASFVTALAAAPAFLLILFVIPESPTWLHNKGYIERMKESERQIARIAGIQYVPTPHRQVEKVLSLTQLLASKGTLRRLSVLWCMWFIAAISSYSNDLNSNQLSGNFYFNQLLFGIIIYVSKIVMATTDRFYPGFSRRKLHQGAQIGACVCFAIMAYLLSVEDKDWKMVLLNILGTVFLEYTWDACYLCAVENNATNCRGAAVGTCSLMARCGAILAPSLAFLTSFWSGAVYTTVFVLGFINLLVSFFFLVETKNVNLDNVTIDQDDNEDTPLKDF